MKKDLMSVIKGMLFLAVLIPSGISAQQMQKSNSEDRAKSMTQMMQNQFNLTADQVPKVNDINLKYTKEMEAIMMNKEKPNKMEEMSKMSERKDAELKGVLNAEQYHKYHDMEAQRREMMKNRMQNRPQGMPPTAQPGGAAPQNAPSGK